MVANLFQESPFRTLISFHKLIDQLGVIASTEVGYRADYAKALLAEVAKYPELTNGIENHQLIETHKELIKNLLSDLFPSALTKNEIKAVTIPFQNFTFNYTQRFVNILDDAGLDFKFMIRDFNEDQFFINNCCLILQNYYHQDIDFNWPLFYDIPTKDGITKYYRILYNGDFLEIIPTENAVKLSQEDINLLIDNYNDIELWKEKFPKKSWILKGFAIISLYDATTEKAISNLKTNLLKPEITQMTSEVTIENIFKSIFNLSHLKIGFAFYNAEQDSFYRPNYGKATKSYILIPGQKTDCSSGILGCAFKELLEKKEPFVISDIEKFKTKPEHLPLAQHLLDQNIKSCIFAPVVKNGELLGIIELMSSIPRALNHVNAQKLDLVLPYLVDTLERYNTEKLNQIEAIIQREYTTIHPSIYWKFKQEAEKYLQTIHNKDYIFKEITFKEVYSMYGQIDIKNSSVHRNYAIKKDLKLQIELLLEILESQNEESNLLLIEQRKFELQSYAKALDFPLKTDFEQQIHNYIALEINPIIKKSKSNSELLSLEHLYAQQLDEKTGLFYQERHKLDQSIAIINKKLAEILDERQIEAQQIFPHYYERFKTDGVEHNIYIGASVTPKHNFDVIYLHNLRLWQLQTLCEMEYEHHKLKASLPYKLDVTGLILVFGSPISIRFRMDEKRFDVDGAYNARYEIVKKRIDKALIKGSTKRIVEEEKITIVYSYIEDEHEYLKYIKYLQFKNIIEQPIEQFEIEEVQGISGLKAIRIKVNHNLETPQQTVNYQDLLKTLTL